MTPPGDAEGVLKRPAVDTPELNKPPVASWLKLSHPLLELAPKRGLPDEVAPAKRELLDVTPELRTKEQEAAAEEVGLLWAASFSFFSLDCADSTLFWFKAALVRPLATDEDMSMA